MKKRILFLLVTILMVIGIGAHPINSYKYIIIEHQENAAKDIEPRLLVDFQKIGFTLLSHEDFEKLDDIEKTKVLTAKYRCRQSAAECLFKIELINQLGKQIYEDEQLGAGLMTRKNDRIVAMNKIFKNIKKLNYAFGADS